MPVYAQTFCAQTFFYGKPVFLLLLNAGILYHSKPIYAFIFALFDSGLDYDMCPALCLLYMAVSPYREGLVLYGGAAHRIREH